MTHDTIEPALSIRKPRSETKPKQDDELPKLKKSKDKTIPDGTDRRSKRLRYGG